MKKIENECVYDKNNTMIFSVSVSMFVCKVYTSA